MKIYECQLRFFCQPLKRYIPVGAFIARYENATRLVVQDAQQSDQDPFNILVDGQVYDSPDTVTWFYGLETNTTFFILTSTVAEDAYGNVSTGGFTPTSKLKIYNDIPYLQNPTDNLWYAFGIVGVPPNVTFVLSQNGIVI